jgi:O-methyltransferase
MMTLLRKARARLQRNWAGRHLSPVARKIKENSLTFLSIDKLVSFEQQIRRVRESGIPGDFMEFGVAMGGTAILLSSELRDRNFRGFDVFGFPPAPSEQDEEDAHTRFEVVREGKAPGLGGNEYYGYVEDLYDRVTASFQGFGLRVDQERIMPAGGIIIVDDYNDFEGCRNAVRDILAADPSLRIDQTDPHAILTKS